MARLARSLGIRPGEGRVVGLVAIVFAAIEVARGFGETAADSLVITRLGQSLYPWLFIGLGIASLIGALAFGAALGRLRRRTVAVGVLLVLALAIGTLQVLLVAGAPVVPFVWLTVYAAGMVAVTLSWTLAGTVLDVRQAKRLFPVLTSAAIGGGFVGTLGAGPAAFMLGTEWVVGLEVVLLAAAAILVARLARDPLGARLRASPVRRPMIAELRAGFDVVAASPLMRLVALAYVLFAILQFSVTSPFFAAMSDAFPGPENAARLATVLGLLSAAVTATAFVLSLVVAPRLYARFGVSTAAVILPIVYLSGFGLWLIAFSPLTAATFRYVQQATQRGVSNAAYSAFYNTVPAERRAQVLAFNDGVPGQIGTILSGVLLLAAGAFLARDHIFVIGAATAVACLAVVLAIRGRYADNLVRALQAGLAEQVLEGGPGLVAYRNDAQAIAALVAALDAPDAATRVTAIDLLGRVRAREASERVAALIADPDPDVRAAALEAAGELDAGTAVAALDGALREHEPKVRTAAVRAAARLDPDAVLPHADRLLADPEPDIRASTAVALAAGGDGARATSVIADLLADDEPAARVAGLRAVARLDGHAEESATDAVLAALDDDDRAVRRAAADVLRARPAPLAGALQLLATGSARAQEAALWSLDGHGTAVRGAVIVWAQREVARAAELRGRVQALNAAAGDAPDPTLTFLLDLVGRRQADIVGRLLLGLAVLGAPEAAGPIRRCLSSRDPDTRAQAVEALDSIGDARLRRAVVGLLDEPPSSAAGAALAEVLRELSEDVDRWIRALALRVRAERIVDDWSTIRQRGARDADEVVRDALKPFEDQGGPAMPDTLRTLGDIDRMLFLRRVPLFAALAPEDLQRLAMTASERLYPSGEAVVTEGHLGDELIVVVEGTVRVVHVDEDGAERLIRRYDPGDHFGELAVLRAAPRAATVIAEPPGVRALVMGGEGLTAILRERPEAAMAMLATLAERISEQ